MTMIIKFRIEAKGQSQNEVADELLAAVGEIAKVFRERNGMNGYWENTDHVIAQEKSFANPPVNPEPTGKYKGRIVMTYRERYGDGN